MLCLKIVKSQNILLYSFHTPKNAINSPCLPPANCFGQYTAHVVSPQWQVVEHSVGIARLGNRNQIETKVAKISTAVSGI